MRRRIREIFRPLAKTFAHGILPNIRNVNPVITRIANPMVRKSLLPDFQVGSEFLLRAIGKSALNELHRLFEARKRRWQNMDMVRHDDKLVKKIRGSPIVIKGVNQ